MTFKLGNILLVFIPVGLVLALIFALAPYMPLSVRDRHLDELHTQAVKGATPAITGAVDQVMACVDDAMRREDRDGHSSTWSQERLVVWDPCVQQGELRLHQEGHDGAIPNERERLAPVAVFLQKNTER